MQYKAVDQEMKDDSIAQWEVPTLALSKILVIDNVHAKKGLYH